MAKKLSIKNMLKPGLMLLIPVFFGCETQNDLGIKYGLDTDANVKFVEFTLPATNVYIDSLRTDRENRILVGKHFDPLTGGVSAEGYFQFSYEKGPLPRGVNESSDTIKLDSIIVTFETGATIPQRGDTYIEFDLYELQDTLENGAIYLSNLQQATGSMIGSYSKSINVALDTLFRIKLDNIYAQEIFSQIGDIAEDDSKTISTSVFKSLGIISGSSSESIASMNLLSDTSRMIIFSSPVDPDAKDTTYLTYFRLSGKHYTYLDRNRLGSGYDGITEKSDFALSNGQTIIDPLAGISTSFSIKELEEFFKENERILINNAITSFEFISEDNRDTLVSFMSYFRKADKGIYGPAILSNPFGNIVMSDNGYLGRESLPAVATLNSNKSEILFPSTLFYQQLLNVYDAGTLTFINPSTGASIQIDDLVLLSSESTSLQRTIFKPNGIKLRLYYTEVDQ
ncbi:DUF4270 family protein [Ekhidna sp.]|uniref:DUF4270 family protein n=1 Tax=Ekhidna sp. TaxID=2608089 RepID=UPI00351269B9